MLSALFTITSLVFSCYALYWIVKKLSKPVVPGGPRVFLSSLGNRPVDATNPKSGFEKALLGAARAVGSPGGTGGTTVSENRVNKSNPGPGVE